ncbi:S-layer homology domain-containing protein [Demequina sp. SO4-13]|uniref:S-layer homology domain-containing protein n=1 Tax=Demequina sp. SO4-13 TaxID=3401027 RepID=UPI003AF9511E
MTGRRPFPGRVAAAAVTIAAATALAAPAEGAGSANSVDGVLITVAHAQGDDVFADEGHASDQDVIVTDDGVLVPVELPAGVEVEAGSQVEATATAGSVDVITSFEQDAADPAGAPSGEEGEEQDEVQLETVTVVAQAPVAKDGASHRAYVVTVDDNATETDVPVAEAVDATGLALDYWMDETDGAIGDFTIADSRTFTPGSRCPAYLTLWNQAMGLYPDVDFFAGTDHLIVYTPDDCTYEYAGIASVGGRLDGGVVHIAANEHPTIVHEIGHNLSLMHSNLQYLKDGRWKAHEYFGLFGPMAGSVGADFAPGAVGASQRYFLGLPGARDSTEHMLIEMGMGDTRTITLAPVYADSGTTAVRLLDSATGETFFVEYRAGGGKDAGTFYQSTSSIRLDGGQVRFGPGVVVSQHGHDGAVSVLTSLTATNRWDAVQRAGTTLVDDLDRFSIAGGATTTEAVKVTITTGGPNPSPFGEEIDWLRDNGITSNWADGTFRPRANVTRDAMAAFLYRLAGEPAVTLPRRSPFTDVTPTNTEFYEEIVWAHQQGITSGWARGGGFEFRPESRITRDAMAAFLYRYAGATATATGEASFKDVSRTSSEFYDEITWMANAGISTGWKDGTFRPLDHVTREAMAAFLYRLAA